MNNDLFETLAKTYPDIIQKSNLNGFEINNGWFNIIDALLNLASYQVNQTRIRIAHYNTENLFEKAATLSLELEEELEKLPTITQVKEKFGKLRFYVSGASDEFYNYIMMAEEMSSRTCEECGSPGTYRNDGWVKVLCDQHAPKPEAEAAWKKKINRFGDDE